MGIYYHLYPLVIDQFAMENHRIIHIICKSSYIIGLNGQSSIAMLNNRRISSITRVYVNYNYSVYGCFWGETKTKRHRPLVGGHIVDFWGLTIEARTWDTMDKPILIDKS